MRTSGRTTVKQRNFHAPWRTGYRKNHGDSWRFMEYLYIANLQTTQIGNLKHQTRRKLKWVWVNTYRYIFSGMNIHLPAILGFTRYQGFDPSPNVVQPLHSCKSPRQNMAHPRRAKLEGPWRFQGWAPKNKTKKRPRW